MMILKTNEQVELMRQSALLVSKTLSEVAKVLKPGVATVAIDKMIGEFVYDHHADGFLGVREDDDCCEARAALYEVGVASAAGGR